MRLVEVLQGGYVAVRRSSLGKVRPGRLSYGVLGLGGFVAARFG